VTILGNIALIMIVLGLPIYLVIRFGWRGVFMGAFAMWVLGFLAGELQRAGEPKSESLGPAVWIVMGWLVSLIYCAIVLGARQVVHLILRKTKKPLGAHEG
jgi:hypothetical protein